MLDSTVMGLSARISALERELERRQVEIPFASFPQVRAKQTGSQSIAWGTITTLLYNVEDWDYGDFHSTVSNTGNFVCPSTGFYDFGAWVVWTPDTTGERWLVSDVNGVVNPFGTILVPGAGSQHWMTIHGHYRCNAGDVIHFQAFQSRGAGTALTVVGGAAWVAKMSL